MPEISRARVVDWSVALGLTFVLCGVYAVEAVSPRPRPVPGQEKIGNLISGGSKAFVERTKPNREKFVIEFGGTHETELAVGEGLNWLARHQARDGSWSNVCLGPASWSSLSVCDQSNPCDRPGASHITAHTGLALLALQAAGNYDFNGKPMSAHTRRGLDWLAKNQWPDGALVGSRPPDDSPQARLPNTFMYEHAIATFALAEACAIRLASNEKPDPPIRAAAARALEFIETLQHDDGGWRYTKAPGEASDSSVSGWAVLALKSGMDAGFPVKEETKENVRTFFASCENPTGRTRYLAPGHGQGSEATTAVGMLVHLFLLKDRNAPVVINAAPLLADQADKYRTQILKHNPEYYTLYNATLALYQVGGEDWERWNKAVRDPMVQRQVGGDGCNRGSWDPDGGWGAPGGRIYSTALATLMLEVYYRYSRTEIAGKP